MSVPQELRYSREHEWVRVDGSIARVGITDFAQESLGDVVFVQLPDVGLEIVAGASAAEIESLASVWRMERFLRKSMMSLPCAAFRK